MKIKSILATNRYHKLRWLFFIITAFVLLRIMLDKFTVKVTLPKYWYKRQGVNSAFIYWVHDLVVLDFMSRRENWGTSNLGTLLFKDQGRISPNNNQKSQYSVLIWKVGPMLEQRHIYNYGTKRHDPLEQCSVQNCQFTYKDEDIRTADAVVIHLHRNEVPNATYQADRDPNQRWIFLTDESPEHTFLTQKSNIWTNYVGIFNWSMSYRVESDIPVPYGRVVPLESAIPPGDLTDEGLMTLIPNWKTKRSDVLVAILISNCTSKRMKFLRELMKYLKVHVYGSCSYEFPKDNCPGHYHADCNIINHYYFYLAFENSKCKEYITEKTYYNAYAKGSIPIVIGTDSKSANALLPPYSYIYAEKYPGPEALANAVLNLGNNVKQMLAYHSWRHHFNVLNEHGYFKTPSVHYCRVCEALNYNDQTDSVYNRRKLEQFLDPMTSCVSDEREKRLEEQRMEKPVDPDD